MAPGLPNRLYQQNHCGMYRSDDGGASWQSIEEGLPSSFGFPVAAHPRDPDRLYFLPLNGAEKGRYPPEGKAAVWRSDNFWPALARHAKRPAAVGRLLWRDATGDGDRPPRPCRRLLRLE